MSHPKPQQLGNDHNQRLIERVDAEAHEVYEVSVMLDANARLDGKIATQFRRNGEREAADRALLEQEGELQESREQKEYVLELLLEEEILRRVASQPEDALGLRTRLPQLRGAVNALLEVVRLNTVEMSVPRQNLERTYQSLMQAISQPLGERSATVALLETLESYLKQVQRLAQTDVAIRTVWIEQATLIAAIL